MKEEERKGSGCICKRRACICVTDNVVDRPAGLLQKTKHHFLFLISSVLFSNMHQKKYYKLYNMYILLLRCAIGPLSASAMCLCGLQHVCTYCCPPLHLAPMWCTAHVHTPQHTEDLVHMKSVQFLSNGQRNQTTPPLSPNQARVITLSSPGTSIDRS